MSACTLRSRSEGWCGNCDWEYVLKTNKTEESAPDESCAVCVRVCVRALAFLSLMSQREVPTPPDRKKKYNYRMLSTLMQIRFNWLFVYMLHSAAHGRSLTSASKNRLPAGGFFFFFQFKGSLIHPIFFGLLLRPALQWRSPVTQFATYA